MRLVDRITLLVCQKLRQRQPMPPRQEVQPNGTLVPQQERAYELGSWPEQKEKA